MTRTDRPSVLGWILAGLLPAMILTVGFCISRAGEIRRENRRRLQIVRDRLAGEVQRWAQEHRPGQPLATMIERDIQARARLLEILMPPAQLGQDVWCLLISRDGQVLSSASPPGPAGGPGGIESARKQMGPGSMDFTFEGPNGRMVRASYAPIPGLEGGLLLCQDSSAVNRTVHRMLYEALLLLGAVSAGLVSVVALFGGSARSICRKAPVTEGTPAANCASDPSVRLSARGPADRVGSPGLYIGRQAGDPKMPSISGKEREE